MNYCSKETVASKLLEADGETLKYPGVSFTIRKMNERRRVKRELTIAPIRMRVNEETDALKKAIADKESLAAGELDKLNIAFGETLNGEWYPAWIRWGVAAIDGLTIDDVPATIDSLCEVGPTDLIEEIFLAVIAASGLSAPESKTLPSAGSSGDPADGKTSDSTANAATSSENGEPETALSSTQAT